MRQKLRATPLKSGPADSKTTPFPIVGIGGSAGGLEAFRKLLNNLPDEPGMAFVFIMHLSPKYKNMLPELLARETKMPVCQAQSRMALQINHVYIKPPGMNMSISGGKLILERRKKTDLFNMPVDGFFSSLAKEQGARAIGVILSGTAMDGTLGAEAIKSGGGITFAQDEKSAKFNGMPQSAIIKGCMDFVLSPEKIARELEHIAKHPYIARVTSKADEPIIMDDEGFKSIFDILRRARGVDFTYYKAPTISRRVARRMILLKLKKLKDYIKFLRGNKSEVDNLYEDLLVNFTRFFREPEVFDALKKQVLPVILKNRENGRIVKIWVPGCSGGEEAYSIAIYVLEVLGNKIGKVRVEIFASDVSERNINKARRGIYGKNVIADITPGRLKRFFIKEGDSYKVSEQVREMCIFSRQNVFIDPPFSRLDLISCRNLLIYLQPSLQNNVFHKFHYALKPGGFLLLGNSESAGAYSDLFKIVDGKHKIFAKKYMLPEAGHAVNPNYYTPGKIEIYEKTDIRKSKETYIESAIERIALSKYAPCGVVIDGAMGVVHFRGHTGRYLESAAGKPSLNIFKLVREGLSLPLRAAIYQARKTKHTVKREAEKVRNNGRGMRVAITVIPVKSEPLKEEFFLVLFDEITRAIPYDNVSKAPRGTSLKWESVKSGEYTDKLQKELAETKEYLRALIEEQEGANEEMRIANDGAVSINEEVQSSNEELQSANEELATAKEELQSSNEELITANDELQNSIAGANLLNNDLINLLCSINMPLIMMGTDLVIRRITSQAEKALNVISSDIGRPITNVKLNIAIPDFEKILMDVVDSHRSQAFEIKNGDGNWYSVSVRPCRTMENKIDGVVAVFSDITERKTVEERELLTRNVLDFLNHAGSTANTIGDILRVIKKSTGLEAVGIRLRAGDDFPYYVTEGFGDSFVEMERSLCVRDMSGEIVRDEKGIPVLECMCGHVLNGRTNPELPFFTEGGSFWTNCSTDLLASTTAEERGAHTRNRCNKEGYESLALIPLRSGEKIIGLLQFNDRRRNQYTLEMIRFFEGLGATIGIALSRMRTEELLASKNQIINAMFDNLPIGIFMVEAPGRKPLIVNEHAKKLLGRGIFPDSDRGHLSEVYKTYKRGTNRHYPALEMPLERGMRGESSHIEDMEVERPDGTRRLLGIYGCPVLDADNKPWASLVGFIDITDRKKMEEDLKLKEYYLSKAQEIGNVGSWELDVKKNKLNWTDQTYRMFGIPPGTELAYEIFLNCIHPDDREYVDKEWKAALNKKPYDIEHRILVDGKIKWIREKAELKFDERGNCIRGTGFAQDITDRKLAEHQIRERVKELDCLYAISKIIEKRGIKVEEIFQKIVDVLPRAWQYADMACARIVFEKKEYKSANFETTDWRLSANIFTHGKETAVVEVYYLKQLSFADNKDAFQQEERNLINAVAERIGKIIENAMVEEELRNEGRLNLSEAQKIAHMGNWRWDINADEMYWSDEVYRICGYQSNELKPTFDTIIKIAHPEDKSSIKQAVFGLSRQRDFNIIFRIILPDNSVHLIHFRGEVREDERVRVHKYTGTIQDITERDKMRQELLRAERLAEIGKISAGIVHEINNPLYGISNYVELLSDEGDMAAREKYLNMISQGINIIRSITGNLLDLSQINILKLERASVYQLLNEIVTFVTPHINKNNIKVETKYEKDVLPLSMDKNKIKQVLLNLITNSIEAMPDGGTLTINTELVDNSVQIAISDTGSGISKEALPHIFEPFFSEKKKEGRRGVGLGLFMVYNIVSLHKGQIEVKSEVGKGASFVIKLPLLDGKSND